MKNHKSIFTIILFLFGLSLFGQINDKSAYVFKINESIFPSAFRKAKKAVQNAENMHADFLIMELNTYGGAVDMADSIRSLLLNTDITTIAYINHNAASAGALISIACDSIFMSRSAEIGAASVVNQTGEKMPEKYQSYMRATMRATAQAQNRDPLIAEGMVDEKIVVPGIVDSTKIVTFTTLEARENGYCEGMFEDVEDLMKYLEIDPGKTEKQTVSTVDNLWDFLTNPAFQGALLAIIFAGLYFELQSPGIGFALLASFGAAILYFAPNYIEGLAANWEIVLFVVGLLLLALEVFVIPGFGVAGILGVIAIVSGLSLSLIGNNLFDFSEVGNGEISGAFAMVMFSLLASLVLSFFIGGSLFNSPYFEKVALETTQDADKGYSIKMAGSDELVGANGKAVTDLKISGIIEVNGQRFDAVTQGEFIEKDIEIVIKENRGNYFVVTKG